MDLSTYRLISSYVAKKVQIAQFFAASNTVSAGHAVLWVELKVTVSR